MGLGVGEVVFPLNCILTKQAVCVVCFLHLLFFMEMSGSGKELVRLGEKMFF